MIRLMGGGRAPNFFIAGTGKAGTTSLYHYLRQHPQIYMSPVKEPCYFASEVRLDNLSETHRRYIGLRSREQADRPPGWLFSTWQEYLELFRGVRDEIALGEASVIYLWSETAPANIAARIPDAKIIIMLRDPAERAFSQYLHQAAVGLIHCSFREHIEACLRNRDRTISAHYPLLEIGLYEEQVKRYLERFPRENIRIYWYEEHWKQPQRLLADIFQFLGVDPEFRPDTSRKKLERQAPRFPFAYHLAMRLDMTHQIGRAIPENLQLALRRLLFRRGASLKMEAADRGLLVEYYRNDIQRLGSLLQRDLTAWLET
ncbi:MAG TPA: sulfotransferase domain-containing protein [Terriglobia bacterium]|jgi:hypothetical protein